MLAKPSYPSPHLKPAIPRESRYSISVCQPGGLSSFSGVTYIGIDALKREIVSVSESIYRGPESNDTW